VPVDGDQLIRVIVPTRDEPGILKACVESLMLRAARPDRIRLQVIDNRSVATETADLLRSLEANGQIQVDRFDEPFNWARINNVAVANGPAGSILVFANNDVEMLTDSWDERLRETLAAANVGLIGTRLLYPDRNIQHAGVVLGVNDLRPVHEGLGRSDQEVGPNSRWVRPRQVAAVTGAFMALTHDVFDRLGGFDERLAVGYNDIDLCLKVRAEGFAVLYEPGIELIHHESKTRGRADESKVSWDDEELTDLHARWRGWMMFDPGKNPQWFSTHDRPFDGLRNPGRSEILRHIDMSARPMPWSIDHEIDPRGEGGE
jgi:GT2 family glycosyltransferase